MASYDATGCFPHLCIEPTHLVINDQGLNCTAFGGLNLVNPWVGRSLCSPHPRVRPAIWLSKAANHGRPTETSPEPLMFACDGSLLNLRRWTWVYSHQLATNHLNNRIKISSANRANSDILVNGPVSSFFNFFVWEGPWPKCHILGMPTSPTWIQCHSKLRTAWCLQEVPGCGAPWRWHHNESLGLVMLQTLAWLVRIGYGEYLSQSIMKQNPCDSNHEHHGHWHHSFAQGKELSKCSKKDLAGTTTMITISWISFW